MATKSKKSIYTDESPEYQAKLTEAVTEYINRKDRRTNPDGYFDKAGRWYHSDTEYCNCCDYVRSPSRSWPYSYIKHCRSVEHVASLYQVNALDLKRKARELTK